LYSYRYVINYVLNFATLAVEIFGLCLTFSHTTCQCSVNYFIYKSHAAIILLTMNNQFLCYRCECIWTVLRSTSNVALWEFNMPSCTLRVIFGLWPTLCDRVSTHQQSS